MPPVDEPPVDELDLSEAALSELAPLGARGTCLRIAADGSQGWIVGAGKGNGAPATTVSRTTIADAISSGLVERDGEAYRLSAGGRALIRRRRNRLTIERAMGSGAPVCPRPAPREAGSGSSPRTNPAESPLAWLRSRAGKSGRPLIDDEQFAASERLRADLTRAGMTPRITASWSGIARSKGERSGPPGAYVDISDLRIAAHERVVRALAAVYPDHHILFDMLAHHRGLEEIERTARMPPRSAKLLLQQALTKLARHYGLLPPANPEQEIRERLRHWGSTDYRPRITPLE